ncbi:MAG: 50S ribosomal protein L16, partial [Candidatus Aenigmatarchaeota archaeon]
MGLRPARCYRLIHRGNTRQSMRRPRKGYVKGVPKSKVAQYQFGNPKAYNTVVYLVSKRDLQFRHNSIEAARLQVSQILEKGIVKGDFFWKIRVYPHQVLRENPLATGAGADRFQSGMRQSFGKPMSTAAVVRKGQEVFEIRLNKEHVSVAKKAFKQAMYKMFPCSIVVKSYKGQE